MFLFSVRKDVEGIFSGLKEVGLTLRHNFERNKKLKRIVEQKFWPISFLFSHYKFSNIYD